MAATTSAEALTRFLDSSAPNPGSGDLIDAVGRVLAGAGDAGLPYPTAMEQTGLGRPAFLSALSAGAGAGLLESFEAGGEAHIRLTPAGRSLY